MKRKIYSKLQEWKEQWQGRSAVLIDGARRTGKSYIVEEFARREYRSYILIDFNKVNKDIHMDLLADLSRSSRLLVPENSCLADEMERTVHPRDEQGTMLPGIDSDAFHPDILDALLYASRRFMFDLGMESAQFREPEKK